MYDVLDIHTIRSFDGDFADDLRGFEQVSGILRALGSGLEASVIGPPPK